MNHPRRPAGGGIPPGYVIRPAAAGDIGILPEVERIAGQLFKTYPADLGLTAEIYEHVNSVETFEAARQRGHLWVAVSPAGEVVGFALVQVVDGSAHLEELDVLPAHGRRGLGAALLRSVCAWAQDAGHPAVTLRTFRDVPWNGPFYQRHGFRIVDAAGWSSALAELEATERRRGLRTDLRVTMARRKTD